MQRVLVVDDDRQVRQVMKMFLDNEGLEPVETDDGNMALSLIEKVQPSLVFLDIVMPGIDGLEVLKDIKAQYPDLRVIMLTGMNQEMVWKKAMENGATDYLTKPFTYEDLMSNLKVHLPVQKD